MAQRIEERGYPCYTGQVTRQSLKPKSNVKLQERFMEQSGLGGSSELETGLLERRDSANWGGCCCSRSSIPLGIGLMRIQGLHEKAVLPLLEEPLLINAFG